MNEKAQPAKQGVAVKISPKPTEKFIHEKSLGTKAAVRVEIQRMALSSSATHWHIQIQRRKSSLALISLVVLLITQTRVKILSHEFLCEREAQKAAHHIAIAHYYLTTSVYRSGLVGEEDVGRMDLWMKWRQLKWKKFLLLMTPTTTKRLSRCTCRANFGNEKNEASRGENKEILARGDGKINNQKAPFLKFQQT